MPISSLWRSLAIVFRNYEISSRNYETTGGVLSKAKTKKRKKRKLQSAELQAARSLPDRLQTIITELRLANESQLADALGKSPSTCAPWHEPPSPTRPNFASLHRFYAKLSVNLNWLVTGEDIHTHFIDEDPQLDASISLVRRRCISRIAVGSKRPEDDIASIIPEGDGFLDWVANQFRRSEDS